jgi:hypothetical protein
MLRNDSRRIADRTERSAPPLAAMVGWSRRRNPPSWQFITTDHNRPYELGKHAVQKGRTVYFVPHAPHWLVRAVIPEALDAGRVGVVPAHTRRRRWA